MYVISSPVINHIYFHILFSGSDPELYKTHLSAVEASGPPEEYDEVLNNNSVVIVSIYPRRIMTKIINQNIRIPMIAE